MKRSTRILIGAAAISGLLSGAAINQGYCDDANANASTNTAPAPGKQAPVKKSPKVQGCSGQNDCKGLGGCKSGDNGCKFKNSCKGKGGCSIEESDIKAWQKAHKADASK
jgi:hypothetical protein